nr:hypothetical protein [Tanacetum cinerariifolium]
MGLQGIAKVDLEFMVWGEMGCDLYLSCYRGNVVPTTVLTRSRLASLNAARPIPTAVPQLTGKSLRPVKHVVNKAHPPIRRPIDHRPSNNTSNFNKKVTTVKVNKVNVVQDPSQSWLGSPKDTKLLI